jgi:hypothetical protein
MSKICTNVLRLLFYVQYLGTVEAVKDWRAPGSRPELMAFIRSAQVSTDQQI